MTFLFKVAPAELEGNLLEHPHVQDAAVVGVPDERAGELPRAYVVKKPGKDVTEEDLYNYIAGIVLATSLYNFVSTS